MNRVADTSFLITAFDRSDARQPGAFETLQDPSSIFVPPEVLGETLGVIHKRKSSEAARELWKQLQAIPHLRFIGTTDTARIAEAYARSSRLTWVDAAVVHWCHELDATPLCFDPDIEKMAKRSR